MPISSTDLVFYYTGLASAPGDATLSLGGTISADTITDALANNVFDDVSGDEAATGLTEYRAIALKNENTTINLTSASLWVTGYSRSGDTADTISFAVEQPTGSPASITLIADTETDPSLASWQAEGAPSSDTVASGTVGTGTVGMNGDWFGIWLKREVPAGASAFNNRSVTIKVEGETSASPFDKVAVEFAVDWGPNLFNVRKVSGNALSLWVDQ